MAKKSTDPDILKAYAEVCCALESSLNVVKEIWNELGVSGEAKEDRIKKYKDYILDLVREMQEEEEKNKMVVVEKIERYMKEAAGLETELNVFSTRRMELSSSNLPLHQVEIAFREELRSLQKLKESRLDMLEVLKRREEDLLAILGQCKEYELSSTSPLSEDSLESFKSYIHEKEIEREHLQASFEETRNAIIDIYSELDIEPSLAFERKVVTAPVKSFILSSENMLELKKLHQMLEQKLADAKDTAAELREKLSSLWERLQISINERETFLEKHRGYSMKTIHALKQEVKRCEELKSANIAVFIKQLKGELVSWWDLCQFSDEQRSAFAPFIFDEYSEDMLGIFELEVEKMRSYYEQNRDIFELANKRNDLWVKMQQLEERANNPNRLFTNRGGQLLKEEKERKLVQKELPKIEQELMSLLEEYENTNQTPFLLNGYNLAEFIRNQWEERNDNKETVKLQRKVTRNTQLECESKLGTKLTPNSKFKKNVSRTPGTASRPQLNARSAPSHVGPLKRKADGTPLVSNVSKKVKDGRKSSDKNSSKSRPRYSTSKIRRFGKGATRTLDASSEKSSRTRRNIMSRLPAPGVTDASIAPSYTEFQNQLEQMSAKKACRSSVAPQRCLRERNAPAHMHALFPASPHPASFTTKLTLTPGRLTTATQLTLAAEPMPLVTVTPVKPPRRNGGTPKTNPLVRRTSTRLNLKTSNTKSPVSASASKLTTPRGRLPILI